jgi:hypothetical protein
VNGPGSPSILGYGGSYGGSGGGSVNCEQNQIPYSNTNSQVLFLIKYYYIFVIIFILTIIDW